MELTNKGNGCRTSSQWVVSCCVERKHGKPARFTKAPILLWNIGGLELKDDQMLALNSSLEGRSVVRLSEYGINMRSLKYLVIAQETRSVCDYGSTGFRYSEKFEKWTWLEEKELGCVFWSINFFCSPIRILHPSIVTSVTAGLEMWSNTCIN